MKMVQAKPGNDNLFASKTLPLTIVMTTEEKKSGKEFEYHEGRDHIFQILEGTTVYELGGTPKDAHSTKPGEWLAPTSEGATSLTLHKGDMLVIPRGTPHKRTTETSVTFILISAEGSAKV
jgi:quercetin dioxygenase-like cupin family protein